MNYRKLVTEIVCYARGAKLVEYSENMAVNEKGELIHEVHVTYVDRDSVEKTELLLTVDE